MEDSSSIGLAITFREDEVPRSTREELLHELRLAGSHGPEVVRGPSLPGAKEPLGLLLAISLAGTFIQLLNLVVNVLSQLDAREGHYTITITRGNVTESVQGLTRNEYLQAIERLSSASEPASVIVGRARL